MTSSDTKPPWQTARSQYIHIPATSVSLPIHHFSSRASALVLSLHTTTGFRYFHMTDASKVENGDGLAVPEGLDNHFNDI